MKLKNIKKMKKTIVIATALILGFSSCKKEDDPVVSNSYSGSAKISGVVKAELDVTNANPEFAPAGTVVLLEYNQEDLYLNPDPTRVYETKTVSTTVDANGEFSATVPTNGKAVDVSVMPQDFAYNQITGAGTTARVVFTVSPVTTSVVKGASKVIDFNY